MLVKLSPAQHLLYRHLLVTLARKDLIAMTAEAQKHDELTAAEATAAAAAADGGASGGGDARASPQVTPAPGGDGGGVEDANGGGQKAAAATAEAGNSMMDEGHYQKLSILLLQLRWVLLGLANEGEQSGPLLAVHAVSSLCTFSVRVS